MRVALVSPYSWTAPGGVTRHVDALAGTLIGRGHEVRALSPAGPGAALPEWVVPLGGTVGLPFNGARSNLALAPGVGGRVLRELRAFGPDVVHLHEPVAPWPCWSALAYADAPLVGTFHTYGTSRLTHGFAALWGSLPRMERLAVRIAVSEAAAWTGRSFYAGEYRVIPNGVELAELPAAERSTGFRVVFVGRPEARKGLPVLRQAFEALRREVPEAELELVGVEGPASEADKRAALARADVLAAPSLGGESFGMVLTEAFAAGLPVVASDIPGYRDVARHGVEGLLVPPGDPVALGEALRELALDPTRRAGLAAAARLRAAEFAWPTVAERIELAYLDACRAPARRACTTATGGAGAPVAAVPRVRSRRLPAPLPPLEPGPTRRQRIVTAGRRAAVVAGVAAVVVGTIVALHHVGVDALVAAIARSSPGWTVAALAVMAASLGLRAVAWRALLTAALPGRAVRLADTYRATAIGVLMSATLPARLGEPARAFVAARHLGGSPALPAVLGTMVAQTALNVLALLVLAATLLGGTGPWSDGGSAFLALLAPVVLAAAALLIAPRLLRRAGTASALAGRARRGLAGLAHPRFGPAGGAAQLAAWALQWLACWTLLAALGIDAGPAAAAGVLLAVNVTAIVPVTPSNVGVFQAACVAVLTAHGVDAGDALAYGIVLQAVELATAVALGAPALLREGLSWRDVRSSALLGTPVRLRPLDP